MFKYWLIQFVRIISRILFIFPVKKNRVLFYSFSGKQYSDSPKYISDKLAKEKDFDIIWAINNPEKIKGVRAIKYGSLKHAFYSATSEFIITNTGPWKAIPKRKGQHIINTWHGGGAYKKTGIDNPYKNKYEILFNKNLGQKGVDLFLSSSDFFTKYAIRGAFAYKGEVLSCGLPRNDVVLDESKKETITTKVKQFYGIDKNSKIVLYAPTWRNYSMASYEELNVDNLLFSLKNKFESNWVFISRGHSLSKKVCIESSNQIIDATNYSDMQELLIASDMLISDYSSCIWDFSLMNKPCILYVPDLDMYDKKFAFYTPIERWGFYMCKSNVELNNIIKNMNMQEVIQKILENHEYFGVAETGKATERVIDCLKGKWNEKKH